jgi:hypothetical protein
VPEDELEKLRLTLFHAYEKPKPLPRRIIEAIRHRTRTPKKPSAGTRLRKRTISTRRSSFSFGDAAKPQGLPPLNRRIS